MTGAAYEEKSDELGCNRCCWSAVRVGRRTDIDCHLVLQVRHAQEAIGQLLQHSRTDLNIRLMLDRSSDETLRREDARCGGRARWHHFFIECCGLRDHPCHIALESSIGVGKWR